MALVNLVKNSMPHDEGKATRVLSAINPEGEPTTQNQLYMKFAEKNS
jgi:hypothetical protein